MRFRRTARSALPDGLEVTKLGTRDLVNEALITLTLRPARTLLTMLGTVLGIGAFVAVLGLTATASGQISNTFSVWEATQVTVVDAGGRPEQQRVYSFPDGADQRAEGIDGVIAAGRTWQLGDINAAVTSLDPRARPSQIIAVAASPGYLRALEPTMAHGRSFDDWHEKHRQPVAIIGQGLARSLNIIRVDLAPAIYLRGTRYTVIGILGDVRRNPEILNSVIIPASTALKVYGQPINHSPAQMLVATRPGAADVVASQLAVALRPDKPAVFNVAPPPTPPKAASQITASLNAVFLILAGLTLAIGTAGIANTTLVSVLERTGEIGLRRALGARPRDILGQVLTETAFLGAVGGLIGAALAVVVVLSVALIQQWTALLNPWITLSVPGIGALTGLLAGIYPATRAARIPPLEALRR